MDEGIVLSFDFGQSRIGVAVGNTLTASARALEIVAAVPNTTKWANVTRLISDWSPSILIVGVPRHPDGTSHEVTGWALRFARQLEGRYHLPVYVVDERYSSVVVEDGRKKIDDQSAAVILQQWFDEGCPKRKPDQEV